MWLDKHLFPWDRLPACPLLLKPDRLEAYPTCLGSADHAQMELQREFPLRDVTRTNVCCMPSK
jgi:hypothetical protein